MTFPWQIIFAVVFLLSSYVGTTNSLTFIKINPCIKGNGIIKEFCSMHVCKCICVYGYFVLTGFTL